MPGLGGLGSSWSPAPQSRTFRQPGCPARSLKAGLATFRVGTFRQKGAEVRRAPPLSAVPLQVASRNPRGRGPERSLVHPRPLSLVSCGKMSRCWRLVPELRNPESEKFLEYSQVLPSSASDSPTPASGRRLMVPTDLL